MSAQTVSGTYDGRPLSQELSMLGHGEWTLELLPDGQIFLRDTDILNQRYSGTFTLDGDVLTATLSGGEIATVIHEGRPENGRMVGGSSTTSFLAGKPTLRLRVAATAATLRLAALAETRPVREWSQAARMPAPAPDLAAVPALQGAWQGSAPDQVLSFGDDGMVRYKDETWRYLVLDNSRLRAVNARGTWATWRYAIDGDRLTLTVVDDVHRLAGPTLESLELHRPA
jgi:hypothetical protein